MPAQPPNPYDFLPPVPSFTLESDDVADGQRIADPFLANVMGMTGDNLSPHLRWSGHPDETQSFAVTCFDPDAPTASGFWHWILVNLPVSVTELPRGAGEGAGLGPSVRTVDHDLAEPGYVGPAPPPGHGDHRYIFAVHALSVPALELPDDPRPALAGFMITMNTVARALLTPVYGR